MKTLIYDCETTDLLKPSAADLKTQPHIIEVGLILVTPTADPNLHFQQEHSWLIHPGFEVSAETTKITGITNEMLLGKPSFIEALGEIEAVFLGVDQLICHNLPFDLGMLVTELKRCGREHQFPYPPKQLCTVSAYGHLKGHNLKLTDLYKMIIGQELKQTHRALDDARALAEIVIKEGIL